MLIAQISSGELTLTAIGLVPTENPLPTATPLPPSSAGMLVLDEILSRMFPTPENTRTGVPTGSAYLFAVAIAQQPFLPPYFGFGGFGFVFFVAMSFS